jgi:PGF-CTERM protein
VAGGVLVTPGSGHVHWIGSADREGGLAPETEFATRGSPTATAQVDDGALPAVTVLTWNLYIGTDLRRLLTRSGDGEMQTAVARLLTDIEQSRFDARAEAIADEIASARPDLVGLQEVTLLRLQLPGDYVADPGRTNADEHHIDFLAVLREKLADRGLAYDVVSSISNTDVELPADLDAGSVDVRLTDRDVILARSGLETQNATRRTYDATLTVPLPDGIEFPLTRGYCAVDVEHEGAEFTFVNTHLDSVSPSTQLDQARELVVDLTALDRPVVLVGDFNSPADGSETVTYELLTQFFTDAYAEASPGDPGYTCCRPPRLQRTRPPLSKRLDLVLVRGVGPVVDAERVGVTPDDRVSAVVDGDHRRLWPSDHAGVVATVRLEPAETVTVPTRLTADGSTRPTDAESAGLTTAESAGGPTGLSSVNETSGTTVETTDVAAPGFGAVAALAALGAVAMRHRRRRQRRE